MADNDQLLRLEDMLGRVLVTGVAVSGTLLAIGLAMELAGRYAHPVLKLGLILLMATPILRIAVSLVEYVRMRDWFFASTTGAVLLVLLTSIAVALNQYSD